MTDGAMQGDPVPVGYGDVGCGAVMDFDAVTEVSVIVPIHNAANTVEQQVRALLDQRTARSYEIIMVDDASNDATGALLRQWAGLDGRIRIVNAPGVGAYAARNIGAAVAKGRHLLFCDADDVVGRRWLEAQATALETWPLVGGRLDLTRLNGVTPQRWRKGVDESDAPVHANFLPYACTANLGVRREVFDEVGGFDGLARHGEDVGFCWRVQCRGHTLGWANAAVVHYRTRSTLLAHLVQHFRYGRSVVEQPRAFADQGAQTPTLANNVLVCALMLGRAAAGALAGDRGRFGRHLGYAVANLGAIHHRLRPAPAAMVRRGVEWPSPAHELWSLVPDLGQELRRRLRRAVPAGLVARLVARRRRASC